MNILSFDGFANETSTQDLKRAVMPYVKNGYVVVMQDVSSDSRGETYDIAKVHENGNETEFELDEERGTFMFSDGFDEKLEKRNSGEHDERLTSYASRIIKVHAPVKGMSKEQIVGTQRPVWEDPAKTPLEYKPIQQWT